MLNNRSSTDPVPPVIFAPPSSALRTDVGSIAAPATNDHLHDPINAAPANNADHREPVPNVADAEDHSDADAEFTDDDAINDKSSDDDGAVDLFDLTAAVPPNSEPVVPVTRSQASATKRPYSSRFVAKCAHSGSEISSGSTGSDDPGDENEQQRASAFLNDEQIMTRGDEKRVKRFMKQFRRGGGKTKKRRK